MSVVLWVGREFRVFGRRRPDAPHTAYVASHIAIFSAGYLLIADINTGWLVLNIWHNLQYVLIVWMFNARRFAKGVDPQRRFLSTISQPRNVAPLRLGLLGDWHRSLLQHRLGPRAGLAQRPAAVAAGVHDDQLPSLRRRRDHLAPSPARRSGRARLVPVMTKRGLAGVVAMLATSWLLYSYYDRFWYPPDEGNYAHVAQRILEGETLNLQVQDVHPGYINFLHAAALRVFGSDLISLRYPLVFVSLLQALVLFLVFPRHDPWRAAVATVALVALGAIQFLNPTAHWHCLALTIRCCVLATLRTCPNGTAASRRGTPDRHYRAFSAAHGTPGWDRSIRVPPLGWRRARRRGPDAFLGEGSRRRWPRAWRAIWCWRPTSAVSCSLVSGRWPCSRGWCSGGRRPIGKWRGLRERAAEESPSRRFPLPATTSGMDPFRRGRTMSGRRRWRSPDGLHRSQQLWRARLSRASTSRDRP